MIVHVHHLIVKAETDLVLLSTVKVVIVHVHHLTVKAEIVHVHHLTAKVETDLVLLLTVKVVTDHVLLLTAKVEIAQASTVKAVTDHVRHLTVVVKTSLGEEMKIKKEEKVIVQDSVAQKVITVDHLFLEKVKVVDQIVVLDSHQAIANLRDLHVRFAEKAMIMIQMLSIAKRKELNIKNSSLILMNQFV